MTVRMGAKIDFENNMYCSDRLAVPTLNRYVCTVPSTTEYININTEYSILRVHIHCHKPVLVLTSLRWCMFVQITIEYRMFFDLLYIKI